MRCALNLGKIIAMPRPVVDNLLGGVGGRLPNVFIAGKLTVWKFPARTISNDWDVMLIGLNRNPLER